MIALQKTADKKTGKQLPSGFIYLVPARKLLKIDFQRFIYLAFKGVNR